MANIVTVMFLLWTGARTAPNAPLSLEPNRQSSVYGNKGFIANGKLYDPVKYPYVTRLIIQIDPGQIAVCSGSLISPSFVLSAAHCVHGKHKSAIQVFHSNHDNNHIGVSHIYVHPKYIPEDETADITLLKLKPPFIKINKYAILSGHPDDFANNVIVECVVIGFGMTESSNNFFLNQGYITYAQVKFGSNACELSTDPKIKSTWQEFLCSVPDEHMICYGDSGGPLLCNGYQYGIASHGYNFKSNNTSSIECGSSNVQTRHLFLYHYRNWINTTMKNTGISSLCNKLSNTILAMSILYIVLLNFFF